MPSIATRLADGVGAALANLPLALVPLALALTDVQKIRAVLAFSGFRTGVRFTLPASVLTVWGFVSTPATGVSVNAGVPTSGLTDPATVAAAAGGLLVTAVLSAGYFGSVADALAGRRYRFVEHVRRHFRAFLVVTVAPVAVFAPAALLVAAAPASAPVVLLPLLVVALGAAYLLFATPYLIVLRDTGALAAARASVDLALAGGAYLRYAVGFVAAVAVVSPLVTAVVVSVPVVGLVVGLPAGAVLGLAGNLATMRFVADADAETTAFEERSADDGPTGAGDE